MYIYTYIYSHMYSPSVSRPIPISRTQQVFSKYQELNRSLTRAKKTTLFVAQRDRHCSAWHAMGSGTKYRVSCANVLKRALQSRKFVGACEARSTLATC